jgi:hypothetical protein
MNRVWKLGLLACLLLGVVGCATPVPRGGKGTITMMPFFWGDEEFGIQGVAPVECPASETGEFVCSGLYAGQMQAAMVQQAAPVPLEELIDLLMESITTEELPQSTGTYKGRAYTWDLYSFNTQVPEVTPITMRLDMALADGNDRSSFVALLTVPQDYEAHAEVWDSIFRHAVYAFAPWTREGGKEE